MKVVVNEPTLNPQMVGIGKEVSELYLILDFAGSTFEKERFIIEIRFNFKGEPYFYSMIHTTSEIDDRGRLNIGVIDVLGDYKNESELEDFKVTLTYIDTAPS